ncbi:MAG: rod shape determining protein RodA [Gaiellaceae bacterium]|jgi:rod shape determining protein RodA|nr:rod shape determining protein RodA [Gaiellaceae bacterium]
MLEYAGSQRAGRRERDALHLVAVVRSFDWILVFGVLGLLVVGLWGIGGVTSHDVASNPNYYLDRQMLYAGVGGVALVAAALVDPDVYRRYWRPIFAGTVGLIAVVFLIGQAAHGSTRWLNLGFFTFQPSEFGKLLIVLALAGLLAERQRAVGEWRTTLGVLLFGALPAALVFIQPDLGTALVYLAALVAMLFVAGTPWRHLAVLGLVFIVVVVGVLWAGPAVGLKILKPYQQQRLTCFLHPETCGESGYNLRQSIISVGAGQFRGVGPNGSTQVNLDFLPASNTDFAFSSYAEQRGFVGAVLLLGLYLLVLWRGLRVVTVARDLFSAAVAGGIVLALFFQIFVNVGMTMGIAPITGIPLPFVSVGGSAMIANLAAMGVLLAIYARGRASRRRR